MKALLIVPTYNERNNLPLIAGERLDLVRRVTASSALPGTRGRGTV